MRRDEGGGRRTDEEGRGGVRRDGDEEGPGKMREEG